MMFVLSQAVITREVKHALTLVHDAFQSVQPATVKLSELANSNKIKETDDPARSYCEWFKWGKSPGGFGGTIFSHRDHSAIVPYQHRP